MTQDDTETRLATLYRKTDEDPGAPFEPATLNMLAVIRNKDPVSWARVRTALKKAKVKMTDLERCLGDISETKPHTNEDAVVSEVAQNILAEATDVMKYGDPLQYLVDSCARFVLGAENAIRKLACCVAVQYVPSSSGLHPNLAGETGTGKSWAIDTFMNHLPVGSFVDGGLSPKALAYHKLGDKLFISMDEYKSNEDMDNIMKRCTSKFHEKYDHRTVIKQQAATLPIGSEMTWAVASVDASQDMQVINRQIPLNTNDTRELTHAVNELTIARYGEGKPKLNIDDNVMVGREMLGLMRKAWTIPVRVPFYEDIEWMDDTNRRDPSIFMDLLVGMTAIRFAQREKDSLGYRLATREDFNSARDLFCEVGAVDELIHKLTKRERQMAEILCKHELGLNPSVLADMMGISTARVSQIAHGKDGKTGLIQKVVGMDIIGVTDHYGDQSKHRKVYTMSKAKYKPLEGYDRMVRLKSDVVNENKQNTCYLA